MVDTLVTRTIKPGQDPNGRRILAGISATTDPPGGGPEQGYPTHHCRTVHLLFAVTGSNAVFQVRVWWFSVISGAWHEGELLTISSDDLYTIDVQGLDFLFLQVTDVRTPGTTTISAWGALVVSL